jgi:hypothetical protein
VLGLAGWVTSDLVFAPLLAFMLGALFVLVRVVAPYYGPPRRRKPKDGPHDAV